jgi:hypothetical protein
VNGSAPVPTVTRNLRSCRESLSGGVDTVLVRRWTDDVMHDVMDDVDLVDDIAANCH